MGAAISTCIGLFLFACVMMQQSWDGPAVIQLKDGRTAHCPDHFVTTPAAVSCFADSNGGKNIFTILKDEIKSISIGS